MGEQLERDFICPYCCERISVLLDPSVPSQVYIEDCEVCCHPIEIHYWMDDDQPALQVSRTD